MNINIVDIFKMGVDYGQLLMEEERDYEDIADGFQGMIISHKYQMPSAIAPRRQPHSEEWRQAKKKSLKKFQELLSKLKFQLVVRSK